MSRRSPDAREARAAARARWPISRFRLGGEPGDDLTSATSATARVAMMWELAESGWRIAGRALPTYDRSNMPARLFPPGAARPTGDDAVD
ncbi:MAG: hypothetical protein ABUL77_05445 [Bacteroidota bacterium]